jgi:hypothetical protein
MQREVRNDLAGRPMLPHSTQIDSIERRQTER